MAEAPSHRLAASCAASVVARALAAAAASTSTPIYATPMFYVQQESPVCSLQHMWLTCLPVGGPACRPGHRLSVWPWGLVAAQAYSLQFL